MNARAHDMGLACTRFSSPDGFEDRGNHSCAADLAAIARQLLRTPRLARIVKRRSASLPFPIKGGRIYLYNNNPLLRSGYPGTTGIKTGYTDAAGRCLVASARRGQVRLGVVLLAFPRSRQAGAPAAGSRLPARSSGDAQQPAQDLAGRRARDRVHERTSRMRL